MFRNPLSGDAHEQVEEITRQLEALQNTLGQTVRELTSRLESLAVASNEVEVRQSGIESYVRQGTANFQQVLQSLQETERYLEESFGASRAREQQIETKLAQMQGVLPASSGRIENSLQLLRQALDEKLSAQTERIDALEKTLAQPLERLDEWKKTLPPDGTTTDDTAAESIWLDEITGDLKRLGTSGQLRGNAQLFARQLAKSLQYLRNWETQNAARPAEDFYSEETVQELDRALFRPHLDVAWVEINDAECEPHARAKLRMLETAWLNYRRRLQTRLQERHDFRSIRIVPGETRFNPDWHETTEFFTTPTADRERDNRIIGIEKNGYQIGARVLRRALVRRYLWNEIAAVEGDEPNADTTETAVEDAISTTNAAPSQNEMPTNQTPTNEIAAPTTDAEEDPMKKGF